MTEHDELVARIWRSETAATREGKPGRRKYAAAIRAALAAGWSEAEIRQASYGTLHDLDKILEEFPP